MTEGDRHVEETVDQLAALYAEHRRSATRAQRLANWTTDTLGRPASLTVVIALVLAWMVGNSAARYFGWRPMEAFPFPDLAFVATVAGLLVVLLILTAQRHQDELADKRAQLTLQIAALSERKIAKIIALLEEQRRDNPQLASRPDPEAEAMAQTADPRASLAKLEAAGRQE